MEQSRILAYAKKHIEITASENEIQQVYINNGSLNLEMRSGRSYELSQKEIESQALDYLESEIQDLKN
jgi:hypothetical protein